MSKAKKQEDKPRKHTSVSYPWDLFRRLEKAEGVLDRRRNAIVNIAVKEYLDSYDIK